MSLLARRRERSSSPHSGPPATALAAAHSSARGRSEVQSCISKLPPPAPQQVLPCCQFWAPPCFASLFSRGVALFITLRSGLFFFFLLPPFFLLRDFGPPFSFLFPPPKGGKKIKMKFKLFLGSKWRCCSGFLLFLFLHRRLASGLLPFLPPTPYI